MAAPVNGGGVPPMNPNAFETLDENSNPVSIFDSCRTLPQLDLDARQLAQITRETFATRSALEQLDLSDNQKNRMRERILEIERQEASTAEEAGPAPATEAAEEAANPGDAGDMEGVEEAANPGDAGEMEEID